MRYDAEHKQRTRAKVLKEAAKAIRGAGPHQVGVAEVMAKVGLTHGGFYAHFSSKDELVVAAIAQMFDEAIATFEHVTAGKAPAEALAAYIDFYLSPRHREAQATGCPLPALAADLPRLDEGARDGFTRGAERLTAALSRLIAALGRRDPDELASSALAEMVGALSLARAISEIRRSNVVLRHSRDAVKRRLGIEAT
ncbi:MAG TPA: TetR/AcrR family transcriptional regulator [Stellaceae bacterium]|nr:TetR/AcrR family transcriptional regulator [Stellaceae bacterium]